jgi:hypothetical protein
MTPSESNSPLAQKTLTTERMIPSESNIPLAEETLTC